MVSMRVGRGVGHRFRGLGFGRGWGVGIRVAMLNSSISSKGML